MPDDATPTPPNPGATPPEPPADIPNEPPAPPAGRTVAPTAAAGAPMDQQKNWAIAAHLTTLSNIVSIPGFIGPLIVWLVKKDEMPFAGAHGKEALNFQLTLWIVITVAWLIAVITCGAGIIVSLPIHIAAVIYSTIMSIIATMRASEGQHYQYPATIRFIK
jgi:uncharacterized Tic20 family protein